MALCHLNVDPSALLANIATSLLFETEKKEGNKLQELIKKACKQAYGNMCSLPAENMSWEGMKKTLLPLRARSKVSVNDIFRALGCDFRGLPSEVLQAGEVGLSTSFVEYILYNTALEKGLSSVPSPTAYGNSSADPISVDSAEKAWKLPEVLTSSQLASCITHKDTHSPGKKHQNNKAKRRA